MTVGRVSPVKRLESTIRAVARCNSRHGTSYRLDVLGPTFDGDRSYRAALDDLVEGLGSSSAVSFCGAVSHDALPGSVEPVSPFCQLQRRSNGQGNGRGDGLRPAGRDSKSLRRGGPSR